MLINDTQDRGENQNVLSLNISLIKETEGKELRVKTVYVT